MFETYYPNKWGLTPEMNLNQLPMFISVVKGLKPAMTGALSERVYPKFKEICDKNRLYIEHSNYKLVYPKEDLLERISKQQKLPTTRHICVPLDDPREGSVFFYLAQTQKPARDARRFHWENQIVGGRLVSTSFVDHRRFGYAVGYPKHCVDQFIYTIAMKVNPTEFAYKNTKGDLSFYTNNLPMDHTYFLIHFHPTSFDDKIVINLAKSRLDAIREDDYELAKRIEYHLKLPILVFEEKRALVFDGKLDANRLTYSSVYLLGNPGDEDVFNRFKAGDEIIIKRERIHIYKEGTWIDTYEKKTEYNGFILKFC
jgi:hypothetical protein